MRPRDLGRLTVAPYDVLVVGGGIYGLAIAYEASSCGLRTALVEAGDFGGGTSFNHQKTAHGGLRSLQSGRLDRALEAIGERRALARIAPWLLRPLPFLTGTYRTLTRNRPAVRAAFGVDACLGRRRNLGVEPELHLPAPKLVSRAATKRLFPGIDTRGLTGGAQWYDYQMTQADRLTLAFAAAADAGGADLANYVEAVAAHRFRDRVMGMVVRDVLTRRDFIVSARVTINAAGARVADVMALFGDPRPVPMLKAMNLVTTTPVGEMGLAARSASGRMLTLVPWRGGAIVGTSQSGVVPQGAAPTATSAEVDAFISDANTAFPSLRLTRAQVSLVHRGIVPASVDSRGRADLRAAPAVIDHGSVAPGAFSVIGVKYTTARGVAERVVHAVARQAAFRVTASATAVRTLPGAAMADHESLAIEAARAARVEISPVTMCHLTCTYAEQAAAIVRRMGAADASREDAGGAWPSLAAEVAHAIRFEMAVRLTDVVIRRTGYGAARHPGTDVVAACARVAATELGWDCAQVEREISSVDAFYALADS